MVVHDLDRIEKLNRIKMLKSVKKDCVRIKTDLKEVKQVLDGKPYQGNGKDLAGKVAQLIKIQTSQLPDTQSFEEQITLDFTKHPSEKK